jgi:maltose/moltooligosaccharide transporter
MERPPRSNWQIWNMNFGFFGIQFGWALQLTYMSAIYEYLGARADQIPILWLAAPLTGLLVQPIVGMASDRTWGRLGRRRPYFLVGAILSFAALILMPRCTALWMAAGLLWVLDASINISMQPFRAFVTDLLPESQGTRGYAMQSLFIGLATVIASALPFLLTNVFHLAETRAAGTIPFTVRASFYMGAAAFLGAVLWTVFTTKEYPPENLEEFRRQKAEGAGVAAGTREILASIRKMPRVMRQLAWVQICTWLGLFCMWLYFPVAVARNVFGAADTNLSSLFGGRGVGRRLLRNVLAGVLRIFIRAARAGAEVWAQGDPCVVPDLRRPGVAFGGRDSQQDAAAAVDDRRGSGLGEYAFDALLDSGRIAA